MRVTHPFHPLAGRRLVCVGERYTRYGTRLLVRVDDDSIRAVPWQWTDVAPPDPEVVLGEGRALLRVVDFLDLAEAVAGLRKRLVELKHCKRNNAAHVKKNVPLEHS